MSISIGDAILKMGIDKADFDNAMKSMDEHIKSSMEKLQTGLKIGGAAFTAFGAAGLKMVSTARELNAQLGQTALTMGVSTAEMRDLALSVTNVTFPLESVTKTFDLLSRAGVKNTEDMKASANAFDALADATGSSAEVVAETLIPAFKVFGLELPKSAEEMDRFTWLTKNTTVDLSDFGSAMNYVALYGKDLGVTIDDMVAIMAALEAKGITGSAATRAFRSAVTEATNEGKSLNEVLGISQEEIDGYKTKMGEASGITQKYAAVANEQYGIMDKVKQKFQEISLAAGSFLTPLEPILGAMTALGPVMLFFSTSAGTAAVKTAAHTAALIAHGVAVAATKVAIGAATAAQWLWNAAMSANPIGLIIIAIAALIAAIVLIAKNWDTIREKTVEVWNAIVGFLKGIWNGIVGFFKENWDKILAILFPAVGLPILIARNWGTIVEVVKDIWNKVIEWFRGIPEKIGAIFATVKDWILAPFRAALSGIESGINWLIRQMNRISFTIPSWVPGIGGKTWGINIPEVSLPKFEHGGLITEPTLLYGLRSMRPYAVAGEKGTEVVSPAGAGITNNFNISQLVVREESDIQRIARELFRLQQAKGYAGA